MSALRMWRRSEAKVLRKEAAGTTRNWRWYSGLRMASVRKVSVTYLWKYVGNGSSESRSYTSVLQQLIIGEMYGLYGVLFNR